MKIEYRRLGDKAFATVLVLEDDQGVKVRFMGPTLPTGDFDMATGYMSQVVDYLMQQTEIEHCRIAATIRLGDAPVVESTTTPVGG